MEIRPLMKRVYWIGAPWSRAVSRRARYVGTQLLWGERARCSVRSCFGARRIYGESTPDNPFDLFDPLVSRVSANGSNGSNRFYVLSERCTTLHMKRNIGKTIRSIRSTRTGRTFGLHRSQRTPVLWYRAPEPTARRWMWWARWTCNP